MYFNILIDFQTFRVSSAMTREEKGKRIARSPEAANTHPEYKYTAEEIHETGHHDRAERTRLREHPVSSPLDCPCFQRPTPDVEENRNIDTHLDFLANSVRVRREL